MLDESPKVSSIGETHVIRQLVATSEHCGLSNPLIWKKTHKKIAGVK